MPLKADLESEVSEIFKRTWKFRDGRVVPDETSMSLSNEGLKLDATVLYADISDSTKLVDNYTKEFSAEIYKAFLRCAARIIRSESGAITAYDGDRVMAVFVGDLKNNTATRTALKINYACKNIIQPAIQKQYTSTTYSLKHVVGIDSSELLVARAGIRGANDLVWIGKAANHAAKLCTLDHDYPTRITKTVYDTLLPEHKLSQGNAMWEARSWTVMNNADIYRSNYWWSI